MNAIRLIDTTEVLSTLSEQTNKDIKVYSSGETPMLSLLGSELMTFPLDGSCWFVWDNNEYSFLTEEGVSNAVKRYVRHNRRAGK